MTDYRLFSVTPGLQQADDGEDVSLGTEFIVTTRCWLTQFGWYRPINETTGAVRQGALYLMNGTRVVEPVNLVVPAQGAWGFSDLPAPYELAPGRYKTVIRHPQGRYAAQLNWFTGADEVKGPITLPHAGNATDNKQGTYGYASGITFPDGSFQSAAYFSDVTITDVDPNAIDEPTVGVKVWNGSWQSHRGVPRVFIDGEWQQRTPVVRQGGNWVPLP